MPLDAHNDTAVTITPQADGVYVLSPFPFAPTDAEFAYAGRRIVPQDRDRKNGWRDVLRTKPTEWGTLSARCGLKVLAERSLVYVRLIAPRGLELT